MIYDMTLREIHDTIEKYLPIKTKEKNKNGEVFTPLLLIEEMLNQLPVEVWTNPDLKWLDPANGIGNFPMIIYSLLMNGLKYWESNDKKRSTHIIKNMLFMVELNQVNVDVSRKIFGDDANIFCGSFLEEDWLDVFPKKFDIIIGNPPFNKEVTGVRVGPQGGRTLWNKFIIKSFDVLKPNGYLTFINPSNWRGLGQTHNIWDLLTKKQILYLHIYAESGGKKHFKVGSRFDVYLVQNEPTFKETYIIDEVGEKHHIRLDTLNFLPNYAYDIIFPLLTDGGIDVIYSRSAYGTDKNHMNKTKTSTHKYPVIHSINKNGIEPLWYSNDNTKGHFGVPKVILNFNGTQYSHPEQNDWEGKYGMSQITFGIPISSKEEGDMILKAMNTDEFKTIIKATKWGLFQTDYRMFKYFKKDFFPLLTDGGIDILYGTKHHSSKHLKYTSREKTDDYKYPVIHSINKYGILPLLWANDNTKGHFGVPKVILNLNGKQYFYPEQNDWEGKYGMSELSFGIRISSKEEGDMILKAINTDEFKTIINATKWCSFQTDYRMFKHFKKDFWKSLTDDGFDILYGSKHSSNETLKQTSREKTDDYKYPVIHSINKDGILPLLWANDNTKGHFGVPKVILNFNRHQYSHPEQNDWEGKYGMSQISFGIRISSKEEGDMILKAINTDEFKTIIKATKWGAFQTDYRMFKHFKKDFWKLLCD